jgi:hypothetical protein
MLAFSEHLAGRIRDALARGGDPANNEGRAESRPRDFP